ncbi:hypothetical protein HMPREF2785_00800 [Corynebacterium sp. HMSC067D03]|uniref:hypothetical protein n=1 Tax=Corynebacterium TaxID=1716 RepID=UPI0008A3BB9B|nr:MULTISPECIES: hypothetical protein [Corynebacterium]MDK8242431.1 hypothetical protein [Corynebacterium coyleae]MDK8822924.1 hypothetical protein [Corynebacterium coyleae]OFL18609.1 hypothetical protein HMPREF2785_00800 [Corynebacterium sp. HMSC067D03]OFO32256.1 hypothetical protein HMPREF3048_03340 [Corynebacterium sp. HMSC075D04]
MLEKLEYIGSCLSIGAAVVAIVTGQFVLALVLAIIGVWGLKPNRNLSKAQEIDSSLPIPSASAIKQFRKDNPDFSLTESIVELQKRDVKNGKCDPI